MPRAAALISSLLSISLTAQKHPDPPVDFRWINPLPASATKLVKHSQYFSKIHSTAIGYAIYLPPGYDAGAARYPVVYYLHGGRPGGEHKSVRMAEHFHKFIADGKVRPMIYVFSNGGAVSHYDYPAYKSHGERTLIEELIPHIDMTYRTDARWQARAIEGFSQGGRGSARIAFHHPELFCSAAPFGGGHQYERHAHENNGNEGAPAYYLFERGFNTYDLAKRYAARKQHKPRLIVSVGTGDQNYEPNLHWMAHLDSLGIRYEKIIVPNVKHDAKGVYDFVGSRSMAFHAACFEANAR